MKIRMTFYCFFLLVVISQIGCESTDLVFSKDSYLSKYKDFMVDIRQEAMTYDREDWTEVDVNYKKLSRDLYHKYYPQLTQIEKDRVHQYKNEYRMIKAKSIGTNSWKKLEDKAFEILNGFSS